jgi:broad specificity phosphatase PhoE
MKKESVQTTESNDARVPVGALNNQILVDRITGQVFLKGPVLDLKFPMIIVRHGETTGNQRKVLQGQADGPENQLNAAGKRQARETSKNLFEELENTLGSELLRYAEGGRLIVLTSPLARARETARYFIDYFRERTGVVLTSVVEDGLKEMSFGAIDGLALEEIEEKLFRDMVIRYRTTQDATLNWRDTGETFLDTLIRAENLIRRLNRLYQGKGVVVVSFTHGTFGSSLRTVLGDKSLVTDDNMIAFRDNILGNAVPYWLSKGFFGDDSADKRVPLSENPETQAQAS